MHCGGVEFGSQGFLGVEGSEFHTELRIPSMGPVYFALVNIHTMEPGRRGHDHPSPLSPCF